ncbi:tetratricopeptide repeat protein [Nitrosomonas oligotropha]|uniref:Tetratricopeptide repeat-containing protein n=1 Tax=Nitrosomonas oligotropha TaxID=42354 RepID=A0A1H8N756_9PROT|nr:tetratricopeptide repeat protein [Nitrosomonas oligotropha]SDX06474.1 Tetratricopeptide repeat-containing protein [Nitrosomonas oligotropha]SEO25382.1 Tetratricopeptide repeat-containing protein [Nitrosomonas oligotropha]
MLTNNLPAQRENLEVTPRPIELMLSEDGVQPLTLILQPLEDIAEMQTYSKVNFSLKDFTIIEWGKWEQIFVRELETLKYKEARFHDSPIFFNRLANMAELIGERDREESYLLRVRDLVNDEFTAHRLGDNLIARNLFNDAERIFSGLNLERDVYANLRLAYFHVQRRDLDSALASVNRAALIDPLDFSVRLFEGSLHLVRGEYEQAIQSFRFAAEERQTSCPLFTNLALAYIYIGKTKKALATLRKAAALDPSNENSIALLADLAFSEKRNEDAIPSLRMFLQFEQKNPAMWARLARALLEIGKTDEAIAALKRQGSIESTSLVWNNLGVAYHKRRDKKKAYEAFKYAMQSETNSRSRNFFLAARNISALLVEDRAYKDLLTFTRSILSDDCSQMVLGDSQLAEMYIFYVSSLHYTGDSKNAVRVAEQLLSKTGVAPNIVAWLAASQISYYSLQVETLPTALELARYYKGLLTSLHPKHSGIKNMLTNNIAFSYLEANQIDTAKQYLQKLSHVIHKEPYSTATLGLLHMRKGNVNHAESLYEEAIHLAKNPEDKKRIRQKLNFELGLKFFDSDPSRAKRYLQKAIEYDNSVPQITARARSLLNSLSLG